jgi:hypothetical protein
MRAAEALRAAYTAGITVTRDGDSMLLEANTEPPRALLEALACNKLAILELLRPGRDGWCAADWGAYFDARLQLAASRNGWSHAQTSSLAFECCVVEWLNRHPASSASGRCAWCGEVESSSAIIVPFGTEPGTLTWLHSECWRDWHDARRAKAILALDSMGIRA